MVAAVLANDPLNVSAWLAEGANADMHGWRGRTLLFLAAHRSRHPAIAELLLARGADVRARDKFDVTPLHLAAAAGDEARIGLFLDRGAEIDARDVDGWTPLHCAAVLGRLEEATLLVSRGADASIRSHEGRTPRDLAREGTRHRAAAMRPSGPVLSLG